MEISCSYICNNIVLRVKMPIKIIKERTVIVHKPDNGRVKDIEANGKSCLESICY